MALATSQYRRVEPAQFELRQQERHAVIIQRATVRRISKIVAEASLTELSIYGCRLNIKGRFKPMDRLWLQIAGTDPVAATAIWFDGEQLGCRFDQPIDKPLFRRLTLKPE